MKMIRFNKSFLLLVFFGFALVLSSFAQEEDFQVWGDISAKYKINKKLRLDTKLGIRTRENSELLKQYYWDLGLRYKLNKRFSFGAKYRFIDYYKFGKSTIHRMNLDLVYDNKFGRFSYDIRGRYQQLWFYSDYKDKYTEQLFRTMFELSYNVRKNKIEPFLAIEHYLGLNGELKWLTAQMRYTIGASYPVNKWSDISLAFRMQREYYTYRPQRTYILMVSYSVDLN